MPKAFVFDAYGTLLDVHSAAARHAARLGPDWERFSQDWRLKQSEYTWVRSLAGPAQHRGFERLTQDALTQVAASHGITDSALLADLLHAYRSLGAFPEVPAALRALKDKGATLAILSNGDPDMLADAAGAAGIAGLLDAVLSAQAAAIYKPDARVYRLATDRFGMAAGEIGFVSSNPWDAFGAHAFGFQVFWVNRAGKPDEYGLGAAATVLPDLSALPAHA